MFLSSNQLSQKQRKIRSMLKAKKYQKSKSLKDNKSNVKNRIKEFADI